VSPALIAVLLSLPAQGDLETAGTITEERPKLLVLSPTGDVPEDKRQAIESLVAVELAQYDRYEVLTSTDLRKAVALEGEKQAAGCDDDSCLAEIAGALGAELVVFGEVTKLGDGLLITLNLFEATTAKSAGRVSIEAPTDKVLTFEVKRGVMKLLEPKTGVPPPPPAPAEPAAVSASSTGLLSTAWLVGLVGAGGAIVVGGVAFDLLSPTSMDKRWDAGDAVGPAAYVVGAGLIATGLLFNPFGGE
jgi:hypothetical protein